MKIQMTVEKPKLKVDGELGSVLYRITAQDRVLRERVIRATTRPKPIWMPEAAYQYLLRRLFRVSTEDIV